MQRLREQESDIEFKMLDSGGDEEEHLAAQDLCSLLRAGRIRGWRHLPTLAGRDAKLFGPKAGYKQCAAALADHALGVWPKIAQDIQKPFEARLPRSRYTMLTLASWFDSAEKGEQTMVLARFIRSAFKKESTGTALMRLIGLLVRDPNTYDDEGRTVWSQPTKNLVEGERQPMTKDEALEMADSVLVDVEVVDALVELSAERPRVLSAVNDEFRAEGYTLEYAAMHKELEKERVDVTSQHTHRQKPACAAAASAWRLTSGRRAGRPSTPERSVAPLLLPSPPLFVDPLMNHPIVLHRRRRDGHLCIELEHRLSRWERPIGVHKLVAVFQHTQVGLSTPVQLAGHDCLLSPTTDDLRVIGLDGALAVLHCAPPIDGASAHILQRRGGHVHPSARSVVETPN